MTESSPFDLQPTASSLKPPPFVTLIRAGIQDLAAVDAEMRRLQRERIADRIDDVLIFVEHPEVITAGRRAKRDGIAIPPGYASAEVDRGGGLTWHGPGQLTVYPIFRWRLPGERSVSGAIDRIESWIVQSMERLGVKAGTDPRMHGVWIGDRKIAAIGLSFNHWVSRHGFTINLSTPPGRVERFSGCGLSEGTTSSIDCVTGRLIAREEMERALLETMEAVVHRTVGHELQDDGVPPWKVPLRHLERNQNGGCTTEPQQTRSGER